MDRTISITTGTIVKVLVILGIAYVAYLLLDIVLVLLAAIVIASAIEPGVRALGKYRVPRLLAVILIYLCLVGCFLGLFYFFLPSLVGDVAAFLTSLPSYLATFENLGAFNEYAAIFGVPAPSELAMGDVATQAQHALSASGFFGSAFGAASTVFGGVISFVLTIVFSFYFAVNETGVADFLRFVTPKRYEDYVLDLWHRSRHKIGLWMQGQLLLGALMGIFVYLGLTFLGVKHALLLAVLAMVFELIPVFGPTLAAAPAIVIGFVDGGFTIGVIVILLYIILQQFENHLLYPLVVTKVVGVPPLLVILALIIGAKLAGFIGILLAVPAAAAVQELVRDIDAKKRFASGNGAV